MAPKERTSGPKSNKQNEKLKDSRRDFLKKTGLTLGSLIILPSRSVLAQEPMNCGPLNPINCAPPKPSGPAVPFKPDTTLKVRVRKPAESADMTKLQAATQKMCELTKTNPNDPRAWMQQANVHCWWCGGGGPMEIHRSWWFPPWHRAYLYFYRTYSG